MGVLTPCDRLWTTLTRPVLGAAPHTLSLPWERFAHTVAELLFCPETAKRMRNFACARVARDTYGGPCEHAGETREENWM
jgi:hypothetical protein